MRLLLEMLLFVNLQAEELLMAHRAAIVDQRKVDEFGLAVFERRGTQTNHVDVARNGS